MSFRPQHPPAAGRPRVLVFGFSVSCQPPPRDYVAVMAQALAGGASVTRKAVGGVTLPLLPYLHEPLDYASYDYVVFEVATCQRFAGRDAAPYQALLIEVGGQCRALGALPVFLNLPRADIDPASDTYLACIRATCEAQGWPLLDLSDLLAALPPNAPGGPPLLSDGIHPGEQGARMYGERLADFLRQVFQRQPCRNEGGRQAGFRFTLLPAAAFGSPGPTIERAGFAMACIELAAGASLELELPSGLGLRGLLYGMGPRTGAFEVQAGRTVRKVLAHDPFCYYERLNYTLRWIGPGRHLRLLALPERPAVRLLKGEAAAGPPVAQIAGVLAERL